ncbi:MAG TPA: DUF4386 domain-containing protein [Ktedonobacteraceae bacterium]
MITRTVETSPLLRARVAGFLYLSLLPFDVFGSLYVPSILIVPGDAAATARNIMASESLFRFGIVSALIGQIVVILVGLALYQLLKPVNKTMAVLMVILNLVATPIAMLNELNHLAILLLLHDPYHLTADQLHAQVSLFLNLHANGLDIVGLFWGLWLFPMGYLVFKSGFLPRFLGVLLIIGCVGYLIQSFTAFLLPNLEGNIAWLAVLTSWGELLLSLWLVIKGVNVEQWKKRARESA